MVSNTQQLGVTERCWKLRFSEHVGQVNTAKPMGVHFQLPGHSHSDMSFLPIEKVRSRDRFVLDKKEQFSETKGSGSYRAQHEP